jgi:hypothetical protein
MRSSELFSEVMMARGFIPHRTVVSLPGMSSPARYYIDNNQPTALKEIEDQIHSIAADLAQSVLKRSKDIGRTSEDPSMSLKRPVMANRVRFEIKFESLLRKTISEILKD